MWQMWLGLQVSNGHHKHHQRPGLRHARDKTTYRAISSCSLCAEIEEVCATLTTASPRCPKTMSTDGERSRPRGTAGARVSLIVPAPAFFAVQPWWTFWQEAKKTWCSWILPLSWQRSTKLHFQKRFPTYFVFKKGLASIGARRLYKKIRTTNGFLSVFISWDGWRFLGGWKFRDSRQG